MLRTFQDLQLVFLKTTQNLKGIYPYIEEDSSEAHPGDVFPVLCFLVLVHNCGPQVFGTKILDDFIHYS